MLSFASFLDYFCASSHKCRQQQACFAPSMLTDMFAFVNAGSYDSDYKKLGSFQSIGGFWRIYNNLPKLQFHNQGKIVLKEGAMEINAFSMFQDEVLPEWEHSVNSNGFDWGSRQPLKEEDIDGCWMSLLLCAVGEQFPDGVVGVRIIDKSNSHRILHKLEVWMRESADVTAVADVLNSLPYI